MGSKEETENILNWENTHTQKSTKNTHSRTGLTGLRVSNPADFYLCCPVQKQVHKA